MTFSLDYLSVISWMTVFERFFLTFKLRPYSKRISRSLVKEPKIYFYDYCKVEVKFSDMTISPNLIKFQNVLQIPAIQLVNSPNVARKTKNGTNYIIIATAADWLTGLN